MQKLGKKSSHIAEAMTIASYASKARGRKDEGAAIDSCLEAWTRIAQAYAFKNAKVIFLKMLKDFEIESETSTLQAFSLVRLMFEHPKVVSTR